MPSKPIRFHFIDHIDNAGGSCMVIPRGPLPFLFAASSSLRLVLPPPARGLASLPHPSASYHHQHSCLTTMAANAAGSLPVPPRPPTSGALIIKDPGRLGAMRHLLGQVYGDWDELLPRAPHLFPKPMPAAEAGPSMVPYGAGGETQRRYLWTDAYGVLCFVTLALRCGDGEDNLRSNYLHAGRRLIDATHATLGQPRSPDLPMLRAEDAAGGGRVPPTTHGYVGLRIGKERARRVSDAGMNYDGMYAHYIDKWIFALLRFGQTSGHLGDAAAAETYLAHAEQLIQAIHPFFVQHDPRSKEPLGVYWKVNVDMAPIPGLEHAGPSEDALAWWVVYSLVRHARVAKSGGVSPIERQWQEIDQIAGAHVRRGMRVSSDPLGYGLLGWKAQWMGSWAEALRARLQVLAPMGVLDVESGMMLPFRLYGALLGARLLQGGAPPGGRGTDAGALADRALAAVTRVELQDTESPHSTINKCMLAAALDPLAFARWEGEPLLPMPGSGGGGGAGQQEG